MKADLHDSNLTNRVQYLDPKYDLTFKRVFGEHKNLCMSLINSMLKFEGDSMVTGIEYQTGELIPELPILKDSIVDVRCTDRLGRQFIVEMQMNWTERFKSRVLLNASKAYVIQLDKAADIKLLQPVYALNFVNKNFEHAKEMADEYYHHYKIVNVKHTQKQIKGLEFVFIELKKFKPSGRAESKLYDLWLRFLTEINENTEETPAEMLASEEIREALEYMRVAAFTKDQLEAYRQMKIDILTAAGMLESARDEGEAIGIAKGLAIGEAERESLKAEKEAAQADKEAALKNMVINSNIAGFPMEMISNATGLTIDEIIKILEANRSPKT